MNWVFGLLILIPLTSIALLPVFKYYVMASGGRISPLQRAPNHLARSTEFHNEENTALLGHSHHNDRCGAMASIEIIPMFVTSEYDESM